MTALVRRHKTVMAVCDTRFHAQPHPIKGKCLESPEEPSRDKATGGV